MLSAVAVSVLAVSCCILFPFPLQYVYSCCRCRYVLVPCPRNLITSDHVCCRLFTSAHSCLYPYVFRYKTFRVPVPGPVSLSGYSLTLSVLLSGYNLTSGPGSGSGPGLVRCV